MTNALLTVRGDAGQLMRLGDMFDSVPMTVAGHGERITETITLAEDVDDLSPHLAPCGEIGGVTEDIHAFPCT